VTNNQLFNYYKALSQLIGSKIEILITGIYLLVVNEHNTEQRIECTVTKLSTSNFYIAPLAFSQCPIIKIMVGS